MEQIQIMLKYKIVHTNLNFINIPTIPFELCAGIEKFEYTRINILEHNDNPEDGFSWFCVSDKIRKSLNLPNHRQMRQQELHIIESTRESSISIDKISKFSLRPPEIRYLVDQIGLYYRWFFKSKVLDYDIYKCGWVDGLNHPVYLQNLGML